MEEDRVLLLSALQASALAREAARVPFASDEAAAEAGTSAAQSSLADAHRWHASCRSGRRASSALWGVWQVLLAKEEGGVPAEEEPSTQGTRRGLADAAWDALARRRVPRAAISVGLSEGERPGECRPSVTIPPRIPLRRDYSRAHCASKDDGARRTAPRLVDSAADALQRFTGAGPAAAVARPCTSPRYMHGF